MLIDLRVFNSPGLLHVPLMQTKPHKQVYLSEITRLELVDNWNDRQFCFKVCFTETGRLKAGDMMWTLAARTDVSTVYPLLHRPPPLCTHLPPPLCTHLPPPLCAHLPPSLCAHLPHPCAHTSRHPCAHTSLHPCAHTSFHPCVHTSLILVHTPLSSLCTHLPHPCANTSLILVQKPPSILVQTPPSILVHTPHSSLCTHNTICIPSSSFTSLPLPRCLQKERSEWMEAIRPGSSAPSVRRTVGCLVSIVSPSCTTGTPLPPSCSAVVSQMSLLIYHLHIVMSHSLWLSWFSSILFIVTVLMT